MSKNKPFNKIRSPFVFYQIQNTWLNNLFQLTPAIKKIKKNKKNTRPL